jgi:NADPH-ferrihemoprotein reductase
MITAFSRETSKKVYVQDRLKECAAEVNSLLKKNAHIFVCGDAANMAHGVRQVLVDIVSEQRQICRNKAEETIKVMRTTGKYQVRLYSLLRACASHSLTQNFQVISPILLCYLQGF